MAVLRFREKSQFTYRNLLDLNDRKKAYESPLAVICHIDLNAFFAQCEQLRLGLSEKDPVVCVQWNTLIAVSYAARDYGITRMDRLEQAKIKCPNLIAAHTAVFKKGEPLWKYVDYLPSPVNHKVSLDPYRREGKKVLNVFRSECDLVEKASVDESFMDLGRLVFKRIIEYFPDILEGMQSKTDFLKPIDHLPEGLDFKGYVIAKENDCESESGIADAENPFLVEDWDDLVILMGSMICFELRKKVEDTLGYKTSGGVGRVKTIAKLASGFKKPDQQTIIRNDSIPKFLKYFKLTDFWSLGGKIGNYVKDTLGESTSIGAIRNHYSSPSDLAQILDKNIDLASKIFQLVRGEYATQVEERELLKSMAANKNFRRSIYKKDDLFPWLNVFIGELVLRIQDLDDEYNTVTRPTKMTLSILGASGARHSKQCTLQQFPKDYELLRQLYYTTALELFRNLEISWKEQSPIHNMFPVANSNLSVSHFVDLNGTNTLDDLMPNVKRRKLESTESSKKERLSSETKNEPVSTPGKNTLDFHLYSKEKPLQRSSANDVIEDANSRVCKRCEKTISVSEWQTHQDFHVALDLEAKINQAFEESYGDRLLKRPDRNKTDRSKPKKSSTPQTDKTQSKLPF